MSGNWLHVYLVDAVARKLCVSAFCTTCRASEFRQGVRDGLASATGEPVALRWSRDNVEALARVLAGITPVGNEEWALAEALRCLLVDLPQDYIGRRVELILDGTWAGRVFASMKAHSAAQAAACQAHEQLQEKLRLQRVEKQRLKQEQHRVRLSLKKERDRLWREKSGKPEAN